MEAGPTPYTRLSPALLTDIALVLRRTGAHSWTHLASMIARIVESVLRAPGRWAVAMLLVTAVCGLGMTRITLEDDARALIAGADPEVARQLEALSEFTAVDQLLLHLDGAALSAGGQSPEEVTATLVRAGDLAVQTLTQSGQFSAVRFRASPGDQMQFADAMMPQRFLIDPRPPDSLFKSAALNATLAQTKQALLAPQGIMQKAFVLRDPVGSLGAGLERLANAPGLSGLDPSSGTFFSRDGHSLLVIAAPHGNAFAGNAAEKTMAVLSTLREALMEAVPGVVLRPIGAHRFTHEAQQIVMSDVHTSAALTLLLVVAIFLGFFRRLRLALVALPPIAFGACIAGGVAGWIGTPIHGIVLAFAAACLGLSIDYSIHLLAAVEGTGPTPREALPLAARNVGGSLLLAAVSTCMGLFALSLSSVTAMQQMALLATGAVAGSFVGNLIWIPIILPWVADKRRRTKPLATEGAHSDARATPWALAVTWALRHPGAIVGVTAMLALLFTAAASTTTIDGDLRNLDTRTAAGTADVAAFERAFGDPSDGALLLASASNLQEGLDQADAAVQLLQQLDATHILSPSYVAPGPTLRAQRRKSWCARDYANMLDTSATDFGFRAGSFPEFTRELTMLCADTKESAERVDTSAQESIDAFGALLGRSIVKQDAGGEVRLAVAFEAKREHLEQIGAAAAKLPGLTLIHRSSLNQRLAEIIAEELPRLGAIAFVLVALLLAVAFRQPLMVLRALSPCILALLATLGVLALLDIPINLMNLCVLPLLAGLGIDYGIMMTDVDQSDLAAVHERAFSVTVAAATTLAGFGTLAIADYYAIATIGRSVLLAVGFAALFALLLPVAFGRLRWRGGHR